MKDEIKLKDMTDFLENVYKNIKEQPTLEEELEQERKFINKIKGDSKDEIKEIFNINELFEEWKQFLSWCYENNDKTVEIHRDKLKWVMDYITNLQKENKQLKNIINELEKGWKEQQDFYRYRKDNRYRTFLSKNLDKLKELKEKYSLGDKE